MIKKLPVFGALFVTVFALTLAGTMLSASKVSAAELCTVGCVYELYCDDFTGPKCPNPNRPHYLWAIDGQCLDGNPDHLCLNYFAGCCNK